MKNRIGHAARAASFSASMWLLGSGAALAGSGQPSPWQKGLQEPATEIAERINVFHHWVNIVIIAIAIFVLILLAWLVVAFNEKKNPTPSKTTHNAGLEVAWTIIPIFILVGISIPSFQLLFAQYTYPKPDLVLKATGNQWNWTHAYPDHLRQTADGKPGAPVSFTSIMLNEQERAVRLKKGIDAPRLLAVDNEVVVPVNKVVHVLLTASDVIHNWTVPSFGSKADAVPGRTTATWFKAKAEGVYFGQCSELCGKDHAFMPIAVRVVRQEIFDQWIGALKANDRRKAVDIIEKEAIEQDKKKRVAAQGGAAQPVVAAAPQR